MDDSLTPNAVLALVASAIPENLRADIIIVGSLAASYQLLRNSAQAIRTKDVDGMVAPHARAMQSATRVTDRLLSEGWVPQASADYDLPGTAQTADDRLAVVRLKPPGTDAWFLELLGAPPTVVLEANASGRGRSRLQTSGGHFELPSFAYLGLVQFEPTLSEFGIRIALPEMMALANLLHHRAIGTTYMGQLFAGRPIKRSNKDLGRVVALAFLADRRDENALETWPQRWQMALGEMAPSQSEQLLSRAPLGLQALLASPNDIEQALHTVNNGLLSATPMSADQFVIALRRLLQALS
jgi:hypothetical protein